jgi:hypothetical protein
MTTNGTNGNLNELVEIGFGNCEVCGNLDELRPYGKGGQKICIECGMKDLRTTVRNSLKCMFGYEPTEDDLDYFVDGMKQELSKINEEERKTYEKTH